MSKRILLIDDNVDMLATAAPLVQAQGYALTTFHQPKDLAPNLAQVLNDTKPDLIILDLSFPGVGADFNLLQGIKSLAPQTPTIVFSGYGFQSYQARALELGASCYLIKPMRIRAVLDRVAELLVTSVPALS